jgi:predicted nucleic acid-binding protein
MGKIDVLLDTDALIAADAILLKVPLLSFNTRHFEFIKELKQL